MKSLMTLLLICTLGFSTTGNAQKDENQRPSKQKQGAANDSAKEMNLLDEQVKLFGRIFSTIDTDDEVNPFVGSDNYLEVVDKMKAPEELKQQIREMYLVYDLSLDPKKKDSLKLIVDKMLRNAMDKTQKDSQQ